MATATAPQYVWIVNLSDESDGIYVFAEEKAARGFVIATGRDDISAEEHPVLDGDAARDLYAAIFD